MPPPRRDDLVDRVLGVWNSKCNLCKKLAFILTGGAAYSAGNKSKAAFTTIAEGATYAAKRKCAFTLAEVLITLGIIGVVAAMTMPAVIGHYKKHETISRLKKAYTILNQALKLSENDNGEYEYWENGVDMGAEAFLNKYWLPYFNVLKICNTYSTCGYESNAPWVNPNGSSNSTTLTSTKLRIPFLTSDGILYSISVQCGTSDNLQNDSKILVDLNGSKPPNTFGKDFFYFTRVTGKGILPLGYDQTSTKIDNGCSKGGGDYCAAKIIKDGWQILSDYPY